MCKCAVSYSLKSMSKKSVSGLRKKGRSAAQIFSSLNRQLEMPVEHWDCYMHLETVKTSYTLVRP